MVIRTFTIYDPFSHWPSAYPISQTDSATIVQCLRKHIANHSAPSRVSSDRGANLLSDEVKSFLENLGARKYETTPYKPSSNGSVERFHRFLTSAISHCIDDMDGKGTDQNQWDEHLNTVLLTYRVHRLMGWTFRRSRSSTGVVQTYLSTTFCFERITSHRYKRLKNTWTCYTKLNSTCTKL